MVLYALRELAQLAVSCIAQITEPAVPGRGCLSKVSAQASQPLASNHATPGHASWLPGRAVQLAPPATCPNCRVPQREPLATSPMNGARLINRAYEWPNCRVTG